jgi:predicted ATPase
VALLDQLRPRHLFLILDNAETVLESRTWLMELLQTAGDVRLLVTSRERLRLLGEQHFPLHGLSMPPEGAEQGQALEYEASKLFLDRARRLHRHFRLGAENWPPIRQICRLTGGLPLGLELAATLLEQGDAQEVGAIAAQIARDTAVLAADYPDIAPHQRSIQLVFQHSWERLTRAEQIVLSRLTLFASEQFSHEAAITVTLAEWRQLATLSRKSLIRPLGEKQYSMHPLYRALAGQQLPTDPAEREVLHRAHASYFAQMLHTAVPPTFDKEKHRQLPTLLPLLPDLRTAWAWVIRTGDEALLTIFAPALYRFLRETAQLQEGRTLFSHAWTELSERWHTAQSSPSQSQRRLLAQLTAQLGFFRHFCGDALGARPLLEQAHAEFNALGVQDELRGDTLSALSDLLRHVGEYELRLHLWQTELRLAQARHDPLASNRALDNVGEAFYHMGELAEAHRFFTETIATVPATEPDYKFAIAISNLGLTELALGNLPRARELLEQSLQIRQQYANSYRIASALRSLGELALAEGNLSLAETQLQEALALYTASGRVDGLGPTHLALARVAMGRGEGEGNTAVFHIHTALTYAIQLQLPAGSLGFCGILSF